MTSARHAESRAYLDLPSDCAVRWVGSFAAESLRITLNGEPYELDGPLSVADLLTKLSIDPRRVAVEHNFAIVKRHLLADTVVSDGDRVEIVNFVGGG